LGTNYLLHTLLGTYRSAEAYYLRQQSRIHQHATPFDNWGDHLTPFFPAERLLMEHLVTPSSASISAANVVLLSEEEVLLAQGHPTLASLSMLIFTLLQSDALRSDSKFDAILSNEQRICAALRLMSMTPAEFSRQVAPRLELWSTVTRRGDSNGESKHNGDLGRCVERSVHLSGEDVELAIRDNTTDDDTNGKWLFLLDTPSSVMVYEYLSAKKQQNTTENDEERDDEEAGDDVLPPLNLRMAVKQAVRSYRVPPSVLWSVSSLPSSTARSDGASAAVAKQGRYNLMNALVEDRPLGPAHNYIEWCTAVADLVHR
jgi:hypothetical protein